MRFRFVLARSWWCGGEALWPALWPPLGVAGLFLVVALFGLPRRLCLPWPHLRLLLLFALRLPRGGGAQPAPVAPPTATAAAPAAGARFRLGAPAAGGAGRPAGHHRSAALAPVAGASGAGGGGGGAAASGAAAAGACRRDPRALRAAVLLGLVAGLVVAGPRRRTPSSRAPSRCRPVAAAPPPHRGLGDAASLHSVRRPSSCPPGRRGSGAGR